MKNSFQLKNQNPTDTIDNQTNKINSFLHRPNYLLISKVLKKNKPLSVCFASEVLLPSAPSSQPATFSSVDIA